MKNTKNATDTAAAQDALESIHAASSAGIKAAMPPRWFGLAISVVTGGIVAAASAGETELIAVMLAAMAGVIAMRRKDSVAEPKTLPNTLLGFAGLSGLLLFALAVIAGGRFLSEAQGLAWAPLASGGVFGLAVYVLNLSERREYRARIQGNSGQ
ncbi:MAG: hypothetical protein P8J78_01505 [Maricaulis sp.]|jgi:FtsH-binding integral membrane protein|nr:hypothetical protein [Maricaulis sp.]MDG2043258.1 hypothetical protein [Maricaulis sp.]